MSIQAIQTVYKGYRFRSRLEARWAVFFDALGIAWEYEKEGYDLGEAGWYLPDFWLPAPRPNNPSRGVWLEVKGALPTEDEIAKATALAVTTRTYCLVTRGLPGERMVYRCGWDGKVWHCEEDASNRLTSGLTHPEVRLLGELSRNSVCWSSPYKDGAATAFVAARSARFEHGETPWIPGCKAGGTQ